MPAQPSGAAGEAATGSRRGGFSLMDLEFKKPFPEELVVTRFFLDLEAFRALRATELARSALHNLMLSSVLTENR